VNHSDADDPTKRFIREFGFDLMTAYAFDERQVGGIKGQGIAADMLSGDIGLVVTLEGDQEGRPLQLIEAPIYNPHWRDEDVARAVVHHLGLSQEEAWLRLKRAGLVRASDRNKQGDADGV
jgi:hypothetical protein